MICNTKFERFLVASAAHLVLQVDGLAGQTLQMVRGNDLLTVMVTFTKIWDPQVNLNTF